MEEEEYSNGSQELGYIDCHCHLADDMFDKDLEEVVANSKKDGVSAIVVVPIGLEDFSKVLDISQKYRDVLSPCLGVHPVQRGTEDQRCVTLADIETALPEIEKHVDVLCGIGEIGLDFQPRVCKNPSDKDVQKEVLRLQVELAKKFDLPINVHSCSAGRPTITALKEFGARNVVMHAFDGRPAVAMEGVREGFYFSIPPSIIRSEQEKLVKQVPIDNMLLETDSPGLGPEKGVRNNPSNLPISCEYIAKVKNMDTSEVRRITSSNALKLFPKLTKFVKQ
ncbi:tatD [Mytilus coruscus]|uniref:TatD n=1 Tax=Mytilus coruscus TaxID=42192 RepID=A0A6J7ZWK6_MYTCO|nr:tatD [Mytilus coruscus]